MSTPIHRLVVLADLNCRMCHRFAEWLATQPQLVPIEIVPAGSPAARQRFPELDHAATLREVTVVADTGAWWSGGAAWVICLWALADYRSRSLTLTTPAGFAAAKAIAHSAAQVRSRITEIGQVDSKQPGDPNQYGECHDRRCG